MESDVLWRIHDCEALIKERTSKEHVSCVIKQLDAKILGDI